MNLAQFKRYLQPGMALVCCHDSVAADAQGFVIEITRVTYARIHGYGYKPDAPEKRYPVKVDWPKAADVIAATQTSFSYQRPMAGDVSYNVLPVGWDKTPEEQ